MTDCMNYMILDEGMLLDLERNNDRELPETRDEKQKIRMRDMTTADWQQWQVLYRLRRNRVFLKILDTLARLNQ